MMTQHLPWASLWRNDVFLSFPVAALMLSPPLAFSVLLLMLMAMGLNVSLKIIKQIRQH